ncbi:1, 4-alpha-D-glucan glucohydrolase [Pseudomassariella vexata]|uniref:Glucoamylase n=1 Tax=Pseudomassariella vexata TaxID=1141098 RepID=A0A1Y2E1B2_9PEZI|nr:1, 4-alpha-D-glucan glucohydrolase [Pseudomassariella vexata]ORY65267.1 1, 4-alpha-D-glucan glucohydrolase [Pseudomassariella vexata]
MTRFLNIAAGIVALAALGSASPRQRAEPAGLDAFISEERGIALQGALNNIGPNGSLVPGTSAGFVVASPSKANPDYFYTWTRDSALTMKTIVDEFLFGDTSLQTYIEDYIHAQAVLQTVTNPSGTLLPSGTGLGEPKYYVDGTRFNAAWGRPQRDGPALRAITLMTYSNWLISNGQEEKARDVVWPVIANDLSYTGQYWNATGFDLWEEVSGSSFFTTQSQYRALFEGGELAETLGVECTGCDEAPQVLCFLQSYWNGEYITANINDQSGRSGRDANTILGPISVFDVNAQCDSLTVQPCNPRGLANFKVLIDAFRNASLYPINEGIPQSSGVAVGRYPEDVYYGGNPWYLITLGAAEYLYDAVAQWKTQASLTVDKTSLPFFKDIYAAARVKTYKPTGNGTEFSDILAKVTAYADSFVAVAQTYTPSNGSLSEQFNKTAPGNPLSAHDLTWSYASFVTMAERRAGQYPPSWEPSVPAEVPAQCAASLTKGTYSPALAAGAPNVTTTCMSKVLFAVNASTYYGENVYLVGNTTDLGSWNIRNSHPLQSSNYTEENPLWFLQVDLTAGETVSYGYAKHEDCNQPYIYETTNRTLVVPACVEGADDVVVARTSDEWEGPDGSSGGCAS